MEASDAMSKVVVHMSECQLDDETRRDLKYQETLFESVSLRLGSLEKRMQNIIDLVSTCVPLSPHLCDFAHFVDETIGISSDNTQRQQSHFAGKRLNAYHSLCKLDLSANLHCCSKFQ